ncbi:hypothetical protein BCR34DRAFT_577780 [Clohesyomyces aquaticus]|uniref:Uncharacterized protein n=1 Tax=Clohesyomyces aquaticus TaxID=1231657 RepID=A0A1Y1YIW5_9PLEO|nr:hypothetical protein BCR34DRAFT_577780 [Clohesyomyces aquaticus]
MLARFFSISHAQLSSRVWSLSKNPLSRFRIRVTPTKPTRTKFSTSSFFRIAEVAAPKAQQRYPECLCIYKAGDLRSGWVAFWKATAIFEFGCVFFFLSPQFYKAEEWEPREWVRNVYGVGITIIAALPMISLSYLTAPFVKRVNLHLPNAWARTNRRTLAAFSSSLPPTTRLEFVTLRTFPFERTSTVQLSHLRALPSQWGRFANIRLLKPWERPAREVEMKRLWTRFVEAAREPRWKFYVKEGKAYTIMSGVPGVWEDVAKQVKRQTEEEDAKKEMKTVVKMVGSRNGVALGKGREKEKEKERERKVTELAGKKMKRQTTRRG